MRLPAVIFLFVWAVSLKAQVNLVPNPSFEEYDDCPWTISQTSLAVPWIDPTQGSSDYFNGCGTNGVSVPETGVGYQEAHSGVAYAGGFAFQRFSHNSREYVQVELTDSIIKDIPYRVSFYVNLADDLGYAVSSMGLYFSHTAISRNDGQKFDSLPQVINVAGNPLTNKDDWMLVTDTFISNTGGEKYITIGNFNDDSESDTVAMPSSSQWWNSYYFIDDVSVTSLDTTTAIPETEKPKLKIFPNPAGNQITIEQLSVTGNQLSVEVYDAVGRLVTQSVAQGQTSTIPLNLSKGVYLLRVKEKEEVVFWEKLIIE